MKPRLYLETTIPSYLVARRSPLARIATDQQTTQDWWDFQRHEYELFISEAVIEEISRGDARMAAQRVDLVRGLPVLRRTAEMELIEERLLREGIIPAKAEQDAAHLALAAVHGMNYLLTWIARTSTTSARNTKSPRRAVLSATPARLSAPPLN